jgi:hypothetical protein
MALATTQTLQRSSLQESRPTSKDEESKSWSGWTSSASISHESQSDPFGASANYDLAYSSPAPTASNDEYFDAQSLMTPSPSTPAAASYTLPELLVDSIRTGSTFAGPAEKGDFPPSSQRGLIRGESPGGSSLRGSFRSELENLEKQKSTIGDSPTARKVSSSLAFLVFHFRG